MTPHALRVTSRLASSDTLGVLSDQRLVEMARAGSGSAFDAIVAKYRGRMLRYAGRLVGRDRADDVIQQVFMRAYEAITSDTQGRFVLRPWLYRVTHNACIDVLRDKAHAHEQIDESWDGADKPDEVAERRQDVREALGAVQALPSRQRSAILLRELEGRSYEAIACELGVTHGAVRQLLLRARGTLRAGAAGLVPTGLLSRLAGPWGEAMVTRATDLGVAAGGGSVATALGAFALFAGGVVGGSELAAHTAPLGGPQVPEVSELAPLAAAPLAAAAPTRRPVEPATDRSPSAPPHRLRAQAAPAPPVDFAAPAPATSAEPVGSDGLSAVGEGVAVTSPDSPGSTQDEGVAGFDGFVAPEGSEGRATAPPDSQTQTPPAEEPAPAPASGTEGSDGFETAPPP